jgi:hypothetical protein
MQRWVSIVTNLTKMGLTDPVVAGKKEGTDVDGNA